MISSKPPFALSNEEQIWTCLYRKQREEEIKRKGKEGEQGNKWEGREKGKGETKKQQNTQTERTARIILKKRKN